MCVGVCESVFVCVCVCMCGLRPITTASHWNRNYNNNRGVIDVFDGEEESYQLHVKVDNNSGVHMYVGVQRCTEECGR